MGFDNFLSTRAGVGGLFDDSEENTMNQLQANQGLYAGLQMPDLQNYDPQQYSYIGDYAPTLGQASTISEDPTVRSAQMSALQRMAGLADTGLTDVDQSNFMQARLLGDQVARQGNDAAVQNAQARHLSGSGMEFAMKEKANQDAAQRSQQAGLQAASDSARQKALYQQAYGSALSGVRGQDFTANQANAGILNQFNQMNTGIQNQAQQQNLSNKQNVNNMNVQTGNQAQQYNNQMRQQQYQNQLSRVGGMAGANTQMANGYAAQNAARQAGRQQDTQMLGTIMGSAMGGA